MRRPVPPSPTRRLTRGKARASIICVKSFSHWALRATGLVVILVITIACGRTPVKPPPWDFVVVPASAVRTDWRTLPIVAGLGGFKTLARHERFMTDDDTDEGADLGAFELRWGATGYHSAPRQWVDPRICEPSWCNETTLPIWSGNGGIYRTVSALRFDAPTDTWIVSVTEMRAPEQIGVAFRRIAHVP